MYGHKREERTEQARASEVIAKYKKIREQANAIDDMKERFEFLKDSLDKFNKRDLEIIAIYVHETRSII